MFFRGDKERKWQRVGEPQVAGVPGSGELPGAGAGIGLGCWEDQGFLAIAAAQVLPFCSCFSRQILTIQPCLSGPCDLSLPSVDCRPVATHLDKKHFDDFCTTGV